MESTTGPPKAPATPRVRKGRRDPGDGAVFQRGDGRWVARLQLPDASRRYYYGRTKEEVRRRLREAQRAIEDGRVPADQKLTLGLYLDHWLSGLSTANLKPRTVEYYHEYVGRHLAGSELARKPLARVTPQDLRDLYARKLAAGLSRTSVHHIHAVLHRALAIAEREGVVPRSVAALVDGPGAGKPELTVLTGDQPERFIAALRGEPLEALFVLAVTSGLRQGELLALHWANVDLDCGELEVVGSLSGLRRAERQIVTPKTGRGRRVSLAAPAVAALREHRARQAELRELIGPECLDRGLVFPDQISRFGDFMPSTLLNRSLDRILSRAGLPRIRFHDLRHTAATRMLSRGVHPKIASEMLGHSSIQVTLDRYSHVTTTMQREAVQSAWGGDL